MEVANKKYYDEENPEWGHPAEVRKQYGPFTKYNIEETTEVFKNNKRKYKCVFSACDGFVYATHDACLCVNTKSKKEFYTVRILSIKKHKKKMREIDAEQKRIRAELLAEDAEEEEEKEEPKADEPKLTTVGDGYDDMDDI